MTASLADWAVRGQIVQAQTAIGDRLFLTVSEVASYLRTDERTLRRSLHDGTIPGVRIQSTWRIPAAVFLRLCALDPHTTDGGSPESKTAA